MRAIPREAVGFVYPSCGTSRGAKNGSYNITVIGTAVLFSVLWTRGSWGYRSLAIIGASSLLIALTIDPEPLAQKLSLSALGGQMRAYLRLSFLVMRDAATYFVGIICAFVLLAPVARAFGLWSDKTLPAAYAVFLGIRVPYALFLLATVRRRWLAKAPPFTIQKGNFRSVERASRHIGWSFFMGNVGLLVRCAKQVAILGLLTLIVGSLPARIAQHAPYGWVLGVGIMCAVIYWQGALIDVLYYKIHRTVHASRELYAGLHRIHHKAVIPSMLDAGTESPCELILTEYSAPVHILLPSALYFVIELSLFWGQLQGHLTRPFRGEDGQAYLDAHVDHHRLTTCNFSCGSEPDPQETRSERPFALAEAQG